jgi:hypothetical protein
LPAAADLPGLLTPQPVYLLSQKKKASHNNPFIKKKRKPPMPMRLSHWTLLEEMLFEDFIR